MSRAHANVRRCGKSGAGKSESEGLRVSAAISIYLQDLYHQCLQDAAAIKVVAPFASLRRSAIGHEQQQNQRDPRGEHAGLEQPAAQPLVRKKLSIRERAQVEGIGVEARQTDAAPGLGLEQMGRAPGVQLALERAFAPDACLLLEFAVGQSLYISHAWILPTEFGWRCRARIDV